jgi:hypothetical protein
MGSKTRPDGGLSPQAEDCRNRFLRFFPQGFQDAKYFEWERGYKQSAREQWNEILNRRVFRALLQNGEYFEIAARAVRIESKTNLLFSFEKMALRDAVKTEKSARAFAEGLFALLHGAGKIERKFETWRATLAALPRRQTRVLTTRQAALSYGFDFQYVSKPNWETYALLLEFAETIRRDQSDLRPADMIDLQSFIWVIGSDEYKRMDD